MSQWRYLINTFHAGKRSANCLNLPKKQVCQGRRALIPQFGDRQTFFQLVFLCLYLQKSSPVKIPQIYVHLHIVYIYIQINWENSIVIVCRRILRE